MNIVNGNQEFNVLKTMFNATEKQWELYEKLKSHCSNGNDGYFLYITLTKYSALKLYADTIDNLSKAGISLYKKDSNLEFGLKGDSFLIRSIDEIARYKLDGLKFKKIYFVD